MLLALQAKASLLLAYAPRSSFGSSVDSIAQVMCLSDSIDEVFVIIEIYEKVPDPNRSMNFSPDKRRH